MNAPAGSGAPARRNGDRHTGGPAAVASLPFLLLAWIAGLLAAVMMVSTTLDVAGRYFLNSPLYGAFEVTEISMGLIVFTALPLAILRREMIAVTVVFDLYPAWLQRTIDVVGLALAGLLLGFMSWRLWLYGERLWSYRERTLELRVPKGLIVQGLSVLAAFAALACVVAIVATVRGPSAPRHTEPAV